MTGIEAAAKYGHVVLDGAAVGEIPITEARNPDSPILIVRRGNLAAIPALRNHFGKTGGVFPRPKLPTDGIHYGGQVWHFNRYDSLTGQVIFTPAPKLEEATLPATA